MKKPMTALGIEVHHGKLSLIPTGSAFIRVLVVLLVTLALARLAFAKTWESAGEAKRHVNKIAELKDK